MLGPSTSSERSTVGANTHSHFQQHQQIHPHQHDVGRQPDYNQAAVAVATATGMLPGGPTPDDVNQFHPHQHHYNAAAHFQQQQVQQAQQAQLQQYQLLQQHQQHQQHQQQLQAQHVMQPHLPHTLHHAHLHDQVGQHIGAHMGQQHSVGDFEENGYLTSRFIENEIIKTFPSKSELVKYVKNVLNEEEQCKIVINSSKPKAVYFQCERSGSFRTTVKDSTKRQRVAYTKRNKCGYRLVANFYPPDKDRKRIKKPEDSLDKNLDDKLNAFQQDPVADSDTGELWILRMIHPQHNHPPEPRANSGKKRRSKFSRTLVEKPLNRNNINPTPNFNPGDIVAQRQMHVSHPMHVPTHTHPAISHDPTHTHSVQDPAVIAAMEATSNTDPSEVAAAAAAAAAMHHQHPPVDPNIDPNVDPSVQDHDHSHGNLG